MDVHGRTLLSGYVLASNGVRWLGRSGGGGLEARARGTRALGDVQAIRSGCGKHEDLVSRRPRTERRRNAEQVDKVEYVPRSGRVSSIDRVRLSPPFSTSVSTHATQTCSRFARLRRLARLERAFRPSQRERLVACVLGICTPSWRRRGRRRGPARVPRLRPGSALLTLLPHHRHATQNSQR